MIIDYLYMNDCELLKVTKMIHTKSNGEQLYRVFRDVSHLGSCVSVLVDVHLVLKTDEVLLTFCSSFLDKKENNFPATFLPWPLLLQIYYTLESKISAIKIVG